MSRDPFAIKPTDLVEMDDYTGHPRTGIVLRVDRRCDRPFEVQWDDWQLPAWHRQSELRLKERRW